MKLVELEQRRAAARAALSAVETELDLKRELLPATTLVRSRTLGLGRKLHKIPRAGRRGWGSLWLRALCAEQTALVYLDREIRRSVEDRLPFSYVETRIEWAQRALTRLRIALGHRLEGRGRR